MIEMIIAHLLGDWIFQPRKMVVAKGRQTWHGWYMCLCHVIIYTTCFGVLMPNQSFLFYLSIFIPHFIIDKFSLMGYWIKLRDGKQWWMSYVEEPFDFDGRVEAGFAGLRYALEDNTAHLICLYISLKYLAQ